MVNRNCRSSRKKSSIPSGGTIFVRRLPPDMPMKRSIETERIPIKLWLDEVEEGALRQAKNLANFPFAFHHIALMPDAHQGYGMPIGGVLATTEVIVPNAVGVDIGCGMCAVRTSLDHLEQAEIKKILSLVRSRIPLGFRHHRRPQSETDMVEVEGDLEELCPVVAGEYKSALHQLGTLGSGNHFIEIQQGDDGRIWLMVHSGSRNLGYTVAGYYNRLAVRLNSQWKVSVPANWQLAFLYLDSEEGQRYLREMRYCVDFALANRRLMMRRLQEAVLQIKPEASFEPMINIAHNYAAMERHFGCEVMVHRKGATRARSDEIGIIPGSQGAASYIVRGLGNPDSFMSCSHGAGRKMGRRQARRELDLETELRKLSRQRVIHSIRSRKDLDEAPGAYKDIDQVMADQADLVEILEQLSPLAVIKG